MVLNAFIFKDFYVLVRKPQHLGKTYDPFNLPEFIDRTGEQNFVVSMVM